MEEESAQPARDKPLGVISKKKKKKKKKTVFICYRKIHYHTNQLIQNFCNDLLRESLTLLKASIACICDLQVKQPVVQKGDMVRFYIETMKRAKPS